VDDPLLPGLRSAAADSGGKGQVTSRRSDRMDDEAWQSAGYTRPAMERRLVPLTELTDG